MARSVVRDVQPMRLALLVLALAACGDKPWTKESRAAADAVACAVRCERAYVEQAAGNPAVFDFKHACVSRCRAKLPSCSDAEVLAAYKCGISAVEVACDVVANVSADLPAAIVADVRERECTTDAEVMRTLDPPYSPCPRVACWTP